MSSLTQSARFFGILLALVFGIGVYAFMVRRLLRLIIRKGLFQRAFYVPALSVPGLAGVSLILGGASVSDRITIGFGVMIAVTAFILCLCVLHEQGPLSPDADTGNQDDRSSHCNFPNLAVLQDLLETSLEKAEAVKGRLSHLQQTCCHTDAAIWSDDGVSYFD